MNVPIASLGTHERTLRNLMVNKDDLGFVYYFAILQERLGANRKKEQVKLAKVHQDFFRTMIAAPKMGLILHQNPDCMGIDFHNVDAKFRAVPRHMDLKIYRVLVPGWTSVPLATDDIGETGNAAGHYTPDTILAIHFVRIHGMKYRVKPANGEEFIATYEATGDLNVICTATVQELKNLILEKGMVKRQANTRTRGNVEGNTYRMYSFDVRWLKPMIRRTRRGWETMRTWDVDMNHHLWDNA